MRKNQNKTDELSEAARPIYLITASIDYAIGELLKTKNKKDHQKYLARLDEELTHLKTNLAMLRKVVERQK